MKKNKRNSTFDKTAQQKFIAIREMINTTKGSETIHSTKSVRCLHVPRRLVRRIVKIVE